MLINRGSTYKVIYHTLLWHNIMCTGCFILFSFFIIIYVIVGCHISSRLTATLNLCLIYFKITWALSILLQHIHKKFKINWTKIKGSCQRGRKVATHDSKSDLPLVSLSFCTFPLSQKITFIIHMLLWVIHNWHIGLNGSELFPWASKILKWLGPGTNAWDVRHRTNMEPYILYTYWWFPWRPLLTFN